MTNPMRDEGRKVIGAAPIRRTFARTSAFGTKVDVKKKMRILLVKIGGRKVG